MATDDEFRDFLLVLRRALLLIIRWIERRCGIGADNHTL